MGEPFTEQIVIAAPQFEANEPVKNLSPGALLAVEISASRWLVKMETIDETLRALDRRLHILASTAVLPSLSSGLLCIFCRAESFLEAAENAAEMAVTIRTDFAQAPWEIRLGLAHGLLYGPCAERATLTRVAVRLARAAQAGQILTSLAIAKELDRGWSFAPVGVLPRWQEDRPELATLLEGRKSRVATPSALACDDGSEMLGRKSELRVLSEESQRTASTRTTRWCAIVAPAGGGKSKLLRWWLKEVGAEPVAVVGACASPFGGRSLSLVDDLCRQLGAPLKETSTASDACEQLVCAVRQWTRKKPVVLIVDDLHWADDASLQTLKEFSEQEISAACLVLLALRESFLESVRWLGDKAKRIVLPELPIEDREKLAARYLPEGCSDSLAKRIAMAPAAGNPLYVEHCAIYFSEQTEDGHLPKSLHDVILKRLSLLSRSLKQPGRGQTTAGHLQLTEERICEWLDRLETGDYESRTAIAEYLSLLENIDATLVIEKAILGVPQLRNRNFRALSRDFILRVSRSDAR